MGMAQNAGSGSFGNVTPTGPDTQVHSELRQLTDMIAHLQDSANELCKRLTPVLRDSQPCPENAGDRAATQMLCPVADQLRTMRGCLAATSTLLIEHRDRLEI